MRTSKNAGAKLLGAGLIVAGLLAFSTPARAQVTVTPRVIDFGTVAVGTSSAPASVTLTNAGSRSVKFSSVRLSSSQFSYSGPSSFYLRPSQVLQVAVSFRPTAAQATGGTLTFRRSNGIRMTVSLSGSGIGQGDQTQPPAAVAPTITSHPASRTVIAGQSASFSVSVSGTTPFTYQWKKNGAAISGAMSSSFTTTAATSDNGAQFAVTVSNSVGSVTSNNATLTVNAGTVLLSANPSSLSFGNVDLASTATQQVTLTNSGTANVTLSGMSLSGAGFSGSGISNGQILTPGQKATLVVTFDPAAVGTVTGQATVTSNAAATAVTLSGSGVQQVSRTVSLNWTRSTSTVNGYQVYSSQASGGPYTKLTPSAVNLPSFTDSSVQTGKTYYYVVTAVDPNGAESSYSNQAAATIQ